MRKKVKIEQSPLVEPDTVIIKTRHKDRGVEFKTLKLFRDLAKAVSPPPVLTVSQWADRYRRLSPESAAEPGQWNTDRAPYQREIMDCVNDPLDHEQRTSRKNRIDFEYHRILHRLRSGAYAGSTADT